MVKKVCWIMLALLVAAGSSIPVWALDGEPPTVEFNMDLALGLSSYKDSAGAQRAYQRFSVYPEITYGKFGAGLDLTLELDGNFNLRDLDNNGVADGWGSFTDYLYKIHYIRYGLEKDPLFVRVGYFDSYTLGHGLIMEGFSNTLFYPQVQQLGLTFRLDGALFDRGRRRAGLGRHRRENIHTAVRRPQDACFKRPRGRGHRCHRSRYCGSLRSRKPGLCGLPRPV
jgi:hypothetical protein